MYFQSIYGCSKLLFEVIKGMAGGLHTCANYFLPVYINSLADPDISHKLLYDVLDMFFDNIFGHIEPKKSTLIWTTLKVYRVMLKIFCIYYDIGILFYFRKRHQTF